MMYVLNDDQLLPIWIVIQALNKIRELSDVMERGEVLTEAQAHLIAFVLQLKPPGDHQTPPRSMAPAHETALDA
jgi:hypothetical protein